MSKVEQITNDIYEKIKSYQINSITHCFTRLRVEFNNNQSPPPIDELKKIPNIISVIKSGHEYQFVIGAGTVDHVYSKIKSMMNQQTHEVANNTQIENKATNANNFDDVKKKFRRNWLSQSLSKFSKIFAPIIPCFIASGIITAIATMIQICVPGFDSGHNIAAHQWYNFFSVCLNCWVNVFLVLVGWRFCEIFGGKPWCGAIMGAMFTPVTGSIYASLYSDANHTFLGIPVHHVNLNWFTSGFANYDASTSSYVVGAPMGSMLGVILACVATIYVERLWVKMIHQSVGFVFVPVLTILTMLLLNFLVFFPISGYLILGLSWLFQHITTGQGAPFGDALLAGLYLFLLTFGLSSSLIPVYTMLLDKYGINTIYPLLGMAGFAQIGAAIALYTVAAKGSNYRKTIKSSIISGFLGIDEPLCYGMSIPKIVPFVTGCISAACAGFFIGGMQAWVGINMGVHMLYGVDGLWGLFTTTSTFHNQPLYGKMVYLIGISIASVSCFFFTLIAYRMFKNNPKIKWELN